MLGTAAKVHGILDEAFGPIHSLGAAIRAAKLSGNMRTRLRHLNQSANGMRHITEPAMDKLLFDLENELALCQSSSECSCDGPPGAVVGRFEPEHEYTSMSESGDDLPGPTSCSTHKNAESSYGPVFTDILGIIADMQCKFDDLAGRLMQLETTMQQGPLDFWIKDADRGEGKPASAYRRCGGDASALSDTSSSSSGHGAQHGASAQLGLRPVRAGRAINIICAAYDHDPLLHNSADLHSAIADVTSRMKGALRDRVSLTANRRVEHEHMNAGDMDFKCQKPAVGFEVLRGDRGADVSVSAGLRKPKVLKVACTRFSLASRACISGPKYFVASDFLESETFGDGGLPESFPPYLEAQEEAEHRDSLQRAVHFFNDGRSELVDWVPCGLEPSHERALHKGRTIGAILSPQPGLKPVRAVSGCVTRFTKEKHPSGNLSVIVLDDVGLRKRPLTPRGSLSSRSGNRPAPTRDGQGSVGVFLEVPLVHDLEEVYDCKVLCASGDEENYVHNERDFAVSPKNVALHGGAAPDPLVDNSASVDFEARLARAVACFS